MFAVDVEQASEKGGPSTPSGSSFSDEVATHLARDGEKSTPVVYPEGGLRGWSVVLGV